MQIHPSRSAQARYRPSALLGVVPFSDLDMLDRSVARKADAERRLRPTNEAESSAEDARPGGADLHGPILPAERSPRAWSMPMPW